MARVGDALRSSNDYVPYYKIEYRCRECKQMFAHFSELRTHLFVKHVCLLCEEHFVRTESLQEHSAASHQASLRCSKCPVEFKGRSCDVFMHYTMVHPEVFKPITCTCPVPMGPPLCIKSHPNSLFHPVSNSSVKLRRQSCSIEDHIQPTVRLQANRAWLAEPHEESRVKTLTMAIRCVVEINPALSVVKQKLKFEVSHKKKTSKKRILQSGGGTMSSSERAKKG